MAMDPTTRAIHDKNREGLVAARADLLERWRLEDEARDLSRKEELERYDQGLRDCDAAGGDVAPVAAEPAVAPAPVFEAVPAIPEPPVMLEPVDPPTDAPQPALETATEIPPASPSDLTPEPPAEIPPTSAQAA